MKHGNRTKKMNICMLWLYYLGMYILGKSGQEKKI